MTEQVTNHAEQLRKEAIDKISVLAEQILRTPTQEIGTYKRAFLSVPQDKAAALNQDLQKLGLNVELGNDPYIFVEEGLYDYPDYGCPDKVLKRSIEIGGHGEKSRALRMDMGEDETRTFGSREDLPDRVKLDPTQLGMFENIVARHATPVSQTA